VSLAPTLTVTSANAKPVAADGLDASANTGAAQVGTSLVTGVQVDTGAGSTVAVPGLSQIALQLAAKALHRPGVATGVAVNETAACTSGGTITITGNVSGSNAVVAGDNLTITANACSEVVGNATTPSVLNGTMSIVINAGSFSDTAAFPQHIAMAINANLTVQTLDVSDLTVGDMRIDLTQTSATERSVSLSGASLSNAYTRSGATRSVALKNYSFTQTTTGTQARTNVTASVVTSNPRIGSNVVYTVSTPTPIVTDLSVVLQGSLMVQGAKSSLLLTVTTPDNFTLQVDTNGDGTYESTTTTTHAELQGLL
jgi:hypothetical protein